MVINRYIKFFAFENQRIDLILESRETDYLNRRSRGTYYSTALVPRESWPGRETRPQAVKPLYDEIFHCIRIMLYSSLRRIDYLSQTYMAIFAILWVLEWGIETCMVGRSYDM